MMNLGLFLLTSCLVILVMSPSALAVSPDPTESPSTNVSTSNVPTSSGPTMGALRNYIFPNGVAPPQVVLPTTYDQYPSASSAFVPGYCSYRGSYSDKYACQPDNSVLLSTYYYSTTCNESTLVSSYVSQSQMCKDTKPGDIFEITATYSSDDIANPCEDSPETAKVSLRYREADVMMGACVGPQYPAVCPAPSRYQKFFDCLIVDEIATRAPVGTPTTLAPVPVSQVSDLRSSIFPNGVTPPQVVLVTDCVDMPLDDGFADRHGVSAFVPGYCEWRSPTSSIKHSCEVDRSVLVSSYESPTCEESKLLGSSSVPPTCASPSAPQQSKICKDTKSGDMFEIRSMYPDRGCEEEVESSVQFRYVEGEDVDTCMDHEKITCPDEVGGATLHRYAHTDFECRSEFQWLWSGYRAMCEDRQDNAQEFFDCLIVSRAPTASGVPTASSVNSGVHAKVMVAWVVTVAAVWGVAMPVIL